MLFLLFVDTKLRTRTRRYYKRYVKRKMVWNDLNGSTASYLTCHANPRALAGEYSDRIA